MTEQVTQCPSVASESIQAFPPLPHLYMGEYSSPRPPQPHTHESLSVLDLYLRSCSQTPRTNTHAWEWSYLWQKWAFY